MCHLRNNVRIPNQNDGYCWGFFNGSIHRGNKMEPRMDPCGTPFWLRMKHGRLCKQRILSALY